MERCRATDAETLAFFIHYRTNISAGGTVYTRDDCHRSRLDEALGALRRSLPDTPGASSLCTSFASMDTHDASTTRM